MPVHLVFQGALSHLIESLKLESNPAAVREKQAVKANHQTLLVYPVHSRSCADRSRSTGNQNPLPVGGVKWNRNGRQDRTGEVAGKLRHQHRLQERTFIDALEAWRA